MSDAPSVVPEPTTTASPGKLLEMYIFVPQLRPTESETLKAAPGMCVILSPPGSSDVGGSLPQIHT
jgi:hypothetical protein